MKHRIRTVLLGCLALCWFFRTIPAGAYDLAPANAKEAEARVGQEGLTKEAADYQTRFLMSVGKELEKAVQQGTAEKGYSDFELLFVIGANGQIKHIFLANPGKQLLGKYVVTKLTGSQAAKPPQDNWVVSLSQVRK